MASYYAKKRECILGIIKGQLFTLTTSGMFAFFLARQPQSVLLDRFPPFEPCANAFFFSLLVFQGCVKVAPMS
jgi:hypothetical protein